MLGCSEILFCGLRRLPDRSLDLGSTEAPMLYAWMGFLKPDGGPIPQEVQWQTSEFLSQPFIRFAGPLRDGSGNRVGAMLIFEVDSHEIAENFVKDSPYLQAGLYEGYGLYEYANEIG